MWLTILIGIATILVLIWNGRRRPKNFPPGPTATPFFGHLLQIGFESYKFAKENESKYGEIQGFRLFSNWMVLLNNPDDIREALSKMELTGRGHYNGLLDARTEDANYGVIFSIGDQWLRQRRFSLKTLRDFGFAKRTSERIILEEATDLIGNFRKNSGKPFLNKGVFNVAVFNVIWSILAGDRYNQADERMRDFMKLIDQFFDNALNSLIIIIFFFPWVGDIRNKVPFLFPATAGEPLRTKMFAFLRETIQQHSATIQKGQPRDFIDCLLEGSDDGNFEEMDMLVTLMDFFVAGSETTSTTLKWTFFLLAKHSGIQEKLFEEIQTTVGNREVCLADRPNLPYVDAVTQEIFRAATLTPNGVPHSATEDIVFKGYKIPKGTSVFANIYACHFSKEIWGDPENFRPERFLASDGTVTKVGVRQKAWIPFGVGKRSCLGESLARDEFFLFLTNIVQNFKIAFPDGEPPHSMTGHLHGAIRHPEDHNIVLHNRF